MQRSAHLEIVNLSDTGRRRPHNEDSTASDASHGFALVADGIGGYKCGEMASALAITTIVRQLYKALGKSKATRVNAKAKLREISLSLQGAIEDANASVYELSHTEPSCRGMGATVVGALFIAGRASIAYVGDSRLYRLRANQLEQLTKDHSVYWDLVDKGICTPEEAAEYPSRHSVTRALGMQQFVEVDLREQPYRPGDIYLLCSDGLSDMVPAQQIQLTMCRHLSDLEQMGNELVALANARGGRDNISSVLVRILKPTGARRQA